MEAIAIAGFGLLIYFEMSKILKGLGMIWERLGEIEEILKSEGE